MPGDGDTVYKKLLVYLQNRDLHNEGEWELFGVVGRVNGRETDRSWWFYKSGGSEVTVTYLKKVFKLIVSIWNNE